MDPKIDDMFRYINEYLSSGVYHEGIDIAIHDGSVIMVHPPFHAFANQTMESLSRKVKETFGAMERIETWKDEEDGKTYVASIITIPPRNDNVAG